MTSTQHQADSETIQAKNQQGRHKRSDLHDWERTLGWRASTHCWLAKTEELVVTVSEKAYDEHLTTYLESLGMARKTWTEIMRPAEEEWQRYCEVINRFHTNLDYWLNCHERGIQVYPRTDAEKR